MGSYIRIANVNKNSLIGTRSTSSVAQRKLGIFPRSTGDLVCRECRLVSAIVVVFALGMMALIGAVILWAK